MRKRGICFALAALLLFGCAACGAPEAEPTRGGFADIPLDAEGVISEREAHLTLMSYYGGPEDQLHNYAYAKVCERFPNVTIEIEDHYADGGQVVRNRTATGDLPDMLLVDSGVTMFLAESGSIYPLDEYFEAFHYADYLEQGAVQTCLYSPDGHIYEFPLSGVSPVLWYYNRAMFEGNDIKVPENYPELLEAVIAFRALGIIPCAMFAREPWPNGALFESFSLRDAGIGLYELSQGQGHMSDEALAGSMEKLQTLIAAGMFQENCSSVDFDEATELFKSGRCAMFIDGAWYTDEAYAALGENLGVFPAYPTCDAGREQERRAEAVGGGDTCGIAVTTGVEDPELCIRVAAVYAFYREIGEYQLEQNMTVPVRKDSLVTEQALSPAAMLVRDMMPELSYRSKLLHTLPNTVFADTFAAEMQKLLSGGSVAEFVRNMDACIEQSVQAEA